MDIKYLRDSDIQQDNIIFFKTQPMFVSKETIDPNLLNRVRNKLHGYRQPLNKQLSTIFYNYLNYTLFNIPIMVRLDLPKS